MTANLEEAYSLCKSIALLHYENFPVASILTPANLRRHIFAIYAFARTADDIVDDPNLSGSDKELLLNDFKSDFDRQGNYYKKRNHQICFAVNHTINEKNLNRSYFYDLLDAFRQDLYKDKYKSFEELEEYSMRSANPVGRLILELFNQSTDENNRLSDLFCSGLQYINFWQDLSIDKQMNRYYVPEKIMLKHGYELNDFYFAVPDDHHSHLVDELLDWTEEQFIQSKKLMNNLQGRLKIELWLIWWGGYIIFKQCRNLKSQLLLKRPSLNLKDIALTFLNKL